MMMIGKALLVPVLVVAGWAATTTTAHAAGSCSIVVPAKVSVKSDSTPITAHLKSDCAASGMQGADWGDSTGRANLLWTFSASKKTATATYSVIYGIGPKRALPRGAYGNNVALTQNSPRFVIKNGTWVYVASSRKGRVVYVNGLVHQWDISNAFPWQRKVYLQRYIHGGWQSMLSRTSDGAGKITVGFAQTAVYQYRLLVTETGQAWSGTSASTFR